MGHGAIATLSSGGRCFDWATMVADFVERGVVQFAVQLVSLWVAATQGGHRDVIFPDVLAKVFVHHDLRSIWWVSVSVTDFKSGIGPVAFPAPCCLA